MEHSIHLVVNSTGFATEFCVFEIERNANMECKIPRQPKSYPKCVEYFPENSNYATLGSKETLDQIYKGLADMELSRPALKKKIQSVGYVVTGSLNAAKDTQVIKDVESFFRSDNLKIKTKTLTGEEEAKQTLSAIQNSGEFKKTNQEIAILQIGSDSVEVAFTSFGKEGKVISSKVGIQLILEELSNIKPGINSCRQPISSFFKSEASSYDKCKSFIRDNLNNSQRLSALTSLKLSDYQIYTTGSSWNYYYPDKDNVSMDELNQTGNEFCSLTIDQILKKGIKKRQAYNLCYSLSFKAVLAETLSITKMQIIPKSTYLKSLATSSELFPEICR